MFNRIKQKLLFRKSTNTVLIHIGKCGGSSLGAAINLSDKVKDISIVHISKPVYKKNTSYYIVARDPILRCISAFNWRYKLVVCDQSQKNRFPGEYEILLKYEILNNLAERLYNTSGELNLEVASEFEIIHHLRERISFYLMDFLHRCPKDQIKGVLMQESLIEDIETYFGFGRESIGKEKYNKRAKGNSLSATGKANLVRYIEDDYNCLFRLHNLGFIKKEIIFNIYKYALS